VFKKRHSLIYLKLVSKKKDLDGLYYGFGYDKKTNLFTCSFNQLFSKQIEFISELIDQELIKTYNFGLKLSREHVLKEKIAILTILNKMGNLCSIPEKFEWDEAWKIFSEILSVTMEKEKEFYFKKLSKKKNTVRAMYNCHLESVVAVVLRAIYGKEIPFT